MIFSPLSLPAAPPAPKSGHDDAPDRIQTGLNAESHARPDALQRQPTPPAPSRRAEGFAFGRCRFAPHWSQRGVKLLICLGALGALVCLTLFPSRADVGPAFTQTLEGTLAQLSVPEESYAKIKTARKAADLPVPELSFNGYELFCAKKTKTCYYSTAVGDGNPSVKFAALSPDLAAAFSAFEISPATIGQNAKHSFIIYNDKYYCEYYLRVTTLPLLSIESAHPDEDGDDFIGDRDSVVDVSLFNSSPDEAHTRRLIKSGAEIHVRGASSKKYPQHSYKISLFTMSLGRHKRKNPVSLLDMRKDDDWILYAPFNDPSKARNLLSTNLWWEMGAENNSFGIKNGARARFVEVLMNGRYLGLYALTHQIDGRQLQLEKNPDPSRTEYLYRKNGHKDAFSTDFRSARRNRAGEFELRFPKHPGTKFDTWAPLVSFLEVLGGPEEIFRNRIAEKMEMDNAVDYWLFVNIVSGRDNLLKNTNYVAKLKGDKYVMLFSPWDLDQTWGLNWTSVLPWLTALDGSPDEPLYREGELALIRCLALDLPGVREKVRARYAALRATLLSDRELDRLLNACEADVYGSGAAARNRERWPSAAADADPAALRKFVVARVAYLDKAIADLAAPQ